MEREREREKERERGRERGMSKKLNAKILQYADKNQATASFIYVPAEVFHILCHVCFESPMSYTVFMADSPHCLTVFMADSPHGRLPSLSSPQTPLTVFTGALGVKAAFK